jgi:hypothetical protein
MLVVAVSGGCPAAETQLVVVTETDLSIPDEIDAFELVVEGSSGRMVSEQESLASGGAPAPPFTVGLIPEGDVLGPITITARGTRSGLEVVRVSARTSFVHGESRMLRLMLERVCRGISCELDETCVQGGCVSSEVDSSNLPPWEGEIPAFDAGSRPVDGGRDAGGTDAGELDASPPDAGPDAGRLDAGPVDAGMIDGAMIDAGMIDAGMIDAGMIDAGSPCRPGSTRLPRSGTLVTTSPVFRRPDGDGCPTTQAFEYFAYTETVFCNDGPVRAFDIRQLGTEYDSTLTLADPFLVIYAGTAIPGDPGECLALNDDAIGMGSALSVTLAEGEHIDVVATAWCSTTSVHAVCPAGGFGSYLLRITAR